MEELVTITVDGRDLKVPQGELLWEACKANGIDIPIFCYHTKLGPVGACRTCLVEQEGVAKGPITACSTPVTDGMVIHTRSPVVQKAQRGIFEFLLANHPLDCPICDRGGECPLQDQTFTYGPGTSRYVEPKRHHVKPITLGPTIELDRERCVLCWRCVRFCSDVAEDNSIILLDRGDHSMVGTFHGEPYVSPFSGNVVELCPVGALTSRKQRFAFRPWELKNRSSVCPHCPMGCNINISVRKNDEVIRFLSRDNPEVDNSWLCDRGRFGFEFIDSPQRLRSPLIRRGDAFYEVSWSEAYEFIAERLRLILQESGPQSVAGIASPRLTNEDLFAFKRFMTDTIGTRLYDHFPRPRLYFTSDQMRAWDSLNRRLMPIAELDSAKTILILGANPSEREPVLELRIRQAARRNGAKVVVLSSEQIPLSSRASIDLRFAEDDLALVATALRAAVAGDKSVGNSPVPAKQLEEMARDYFQQGPIAVVYDDSFPEVDAKGEALTAVATLVDAIAAKTAVGVIPMLDDCNSMGARDLGIVTMSDAGAWDVPAFETLMAPTAHVRCAFLMGADLARDVSRVGVIQRLRSLDLLVVSELFMTQTAECADVVLPAASFAEKVGTFTNTERRVQALTVALPAPGMAVPDWQMLAELSQYFERTLDYGHPRDIWEDIRRSVPAYAAVSHRDIGAQGVRPAAFQTV